MIIGTALGGGALETSALAVALAFGFGYTLTMRPLLAAGFGCVAPPASRSPPTPRRSW